MDDEDSSWEGYESGPFCRHWSDPADCDTLCKCGHQCCQHSAYTDACAECDCEEFCDNED